MSIENQFDIPFIAQQAYREKQIQQSYRPIIGVHKWFARRPGALFRALLLSEFGDASYSLPDLFFRANQLEGFVVADPFMGGGTPLFEANRLGINVIGCDINPLAWWIVRQELGSLDRTHFLDMAAQVVQEIEVEIGHLYRTTCGLCGQRAPIKYFFWVKRQTCADCGTVFDLFPNYTVAKNARHPNYVLYCPHCQQLVESPDPAPIDCPICQAAITEHGVARASRYRCPCCAYEGRTYAEGTTGPPVHRLFGIEYHCPDCKPTHRGRFFKTADTADLDRYRQAEHMLAQHDDLPIPDEAIPDGQETRRLHRWGYRYYRELFNDRQLLGLGLLSRRIQQVEDPEIRYALATVFSDFIRYQNMIARYDTWALKCQDVFSVHGFPVRLVQCENNLLGVPGVGAGGYRHFIKKYDRAKAYCEQPFETKWTLEGRKKKIGIPGERIEAVFEHGPGGIGAGRRAWLVPGSLKELDLSRVSLDGVFTDPPYFDNVQYAELMDFLYVWLRRVLPDVPAFASASTRSPDELTGNESQGKGLDHFTEGLSRIFVAATNALKPGAPFAFTYHHNDPAAYAPVAVAILDAGLVCTATLPCPAEMGASLHINGTGSSIVDTIFVCRKGVPPVSLMDTSGFLHELLSKDAESLVAGGIVPTRGDLGCLALGHVVRLAIAQLGPIWESSQPVNVRLQQVHQLLDNLIDRYGLDETVSALLGQVKQRRPPHQLSFAQVVTTKGS